MILNISKQWKVEHAVLYFILVQLMRGNFLSRKYFSKQKKAIIMKCPVAFQSINMKDE
jgi:hypothetical protein